MGESHYISEQKPLKKIRVDPASNWLVTLAYKQRIRISGEMDPL
jgi:hypothetical protein